MQQNNWEEIKGIPENLEIELLSISCQEDKYGIKQTNKLNVFVPSVVKVTRIATSKSRRITAAKKNIAKKGT